MENGINTIIDRSLLRRPCEPSATAEYSEDKRTTMHTRRDKSKSKV